MSGKKYLFLAEGFSRDPYCGKTMSVVLFFSSRSRHTIFDCDWSSDVCSSDLLPARERAAPARRDVGVLGHEQRFEAAGFQLPSQLLDANRIFGREDEDADVHGDSSEIGRAHV